jgi:hypothetical protein
VTFDLPASSAKAVSSDHDFINMVKCLEALEGLRKLEEGNLSWGLAIDGLEEALEGLDTHNHHLLRGASHVAHDRV